MSPFLLAKRNVCSFTEIKPVCKNQHKNSSHCKQCFRGVSINIHKVFKIEINVLCHTFLVQIKERNFSDRSVLRCKDAAQGIFQPDSVLVVSQIRWLEEKEHLLFIALPSESWLLARCWTGTSCWDLEGLCSQNRLNSLPCPGTEMSTVLKSQCQMNWDTV